MTKEIKTTLKCIGLLVTGFCVNYGLTRYAAPDYSGTALAVGIFLTTFGMALAIFSMQIVMLPLGIISYAKVKRQRASRLAPVQVGLS